MRRSIHVLGLAVAVSALSVATPRDASACGGCFHPPTQTASDITDERMLLSVSPTQTTLYDQIRYAGSPSSFAWVLPIHGIVQVGLSADVLFDSVDVLTQTTINPPPLTCPAPPPDCNRFGGGSNTPTAAGAAESDAGLGTVTVTKQENVGPYATVQLHATDSSALNNWLVANGYNIPADVQPIVDQYVTEGFDFLAMKLLPNAGIQAMRPVRVTMPGASLSLPLRMAAVGTGATVGITIWVVSDGRYEPQNFPFFHIEDSALVWDFSISASNYTTLRAQNELALGGKGWELESSINLNETLITNVILSGGQYYGGGGFGGGYPVANPADDYLPVGDADAGTDGGPTETAEQVRTDDISALFAGMAGPSVRVTRMRSDISHAAMTTDFVLGASADQSELTNIRNVPVGINLQCPIYSNCSVVGTGTVAQATAVTGTSSAGAPNAKRNWLGCVAAPTSSGRTGTAVGVLFGLLGMIAVRLARASRRGPGKLD
ncbi:MAG: DUF2330 domain-containing protein [Polyangiales bacterium]